MIGEFSSTQYCAEARWFFIACIRNQEGMVDGGFHLSDEFRSTAVKAVTDFIQLSLCVYEKPKVSV